MSSIYHLSRKTAIPYTRANLHRRRPEKAEETDMRDYKKRLQAGM
jgi:hypothetical protein